MRIGICHDTQERDFTPTCCSAMASRPIVTCSPVATTTSYSRGSCSGAISLTHFTSWLVAPDMAETTTATSLPRATSAFTLLATFLMRSVSPTDVPPNLSTMRAMDLLESGV